MLQPNILDKQLSQRPEEVRFCKKCVVSNQRPRTHFDDDGVCTACQYAYAKDHKIDWQAREKELQILLDKHRSSDGSYDVIVPASGGKDSALVAHQLKHRYGMHPLTITWAPFLYTDIGWKNYFNFVNSGFDNFLFYPNGKLHRQLARVAFETKGDHWEPFAYGQKTYPFHMALKHKIPLIFYGENGEVEYGGLLKNADKPYESPEDWDHLYFKGSGVDGLVEAGLAMGVLKKEDIHPKSFEFYKAPPLDVIAKQDIQMHWWSYYHKWVPQENYYYAVKHAGFASNPEGRSEGTYSKYASLDDKTDGFHWYLSYIKFGLGRASRDAQMEIRSGHITREEAVALVRRFDGEFPKKYFKEFLDYLGITEDHFWEVVNRYRSPHLWKQENGEWKLKHIVS